MPALIIGSHMWRYDLAKHNVVPLLASSSLIYCEKNLLPSHMIAHVCCAIAVGFTCWVSCSDASLSSSSRIANTFL